MTSATPKECRAQSWPVCHLSCLPCTHMIQGSARGLGRVGTQNLGSPPLALSFSEFSIALCCLVILGSFLWLFRPERWWDFCWCLSTAHHKATPTKGNPLWHFPSSINSRPKSGFFPSLPRALRELFFLYFVQNFSVVIYVQDFFFLKALTLSVSWFLYLAAFLNSVLISIWFDCT